VTEIHFGALSQWRKPSHLNALCLKHRKIIQHAHTQMAQDKGEKFISEAAKGSRQESTRSGRRIVMLWGSCHPSSPTTLLSLYFLSARGVSLPDRFRFLVMVRCHRYDESNRKIQDMAGRKRVSV